ncbi:hypothetical protein [Noviherbaspirillum galbum]|uniref:Uncharacterized protein n=1 Tax=Noviherbaspirillum galbum TaxID=2709383 RepID=A0A6B3SPK4_9BURK|nr:hypothetical protein [Noviherbaspirillum galbum]NEX62830.1 hypothetical protein [Noviherbaspirillum galbum]
MRDGHQQGIAAPVPRRRQRLAPRDADLGILRELAMAAAGRGECLEAARPAVILAGADVGWNQHAEDVVADVFGHAQEQIGAMEVTDRTGNGRRSGFGLLKDGWFGGPVA